MQPHGEYLVGGDTAHHVGDLGGGGRGKGREEGGRGEMGEGGGRRGEGVKCKERIKNK